jgi:hypothetical protein
MRHRVHSTSMQTRLHPTASSVPGQGVLKPCDVCKGPLARAPPHSGPGGMRRPHPFVTCFGHAPSPLMPQKTSSGDPNHSPIGLFHRAKCSRHRVASWGPPTRSAQQPEGPPASQHTPAEMPQQLHNAWCVGSLQSISMGLRTLREYVILHVNTVRAHPPCCWMIPVGLPEALRCGRRSPHDHDTRPARGLPHGVCSTASPNQ